ncbi:MAG: phosphoribosylformylglycinamidine synthase subunit PurQ [Alphaproteobacteria bacterium]|nr:phosphoribosylformylglycinamidine synthase subunit PurQ [Alphaproteobacteria bacterium]
MKAAVIVFPGSNRDRDVALAIEQSLGKPPDMIWHRTATLPKVDLIVVPGGFSYGDYLRCGAMASQSPVMAEVKRRADKGVRVIGICNGFQVLTESGLLPGVLMRNRGLKFICDDVHLRVEQTRSAFTSRYKKGEVITFHIAHNEGNFFADSKTLRQIEDKGQVAFRYCDAAGKTSDKANPNGAKNNIAGIFNARRNVLGLMPHPEVMADPLLGCNDARRMFDSMVEAVA